MLGAIIIYYHNGHHFISAYENRFVGTTVAPPLSLDHQRTVFEEQHKILSWNSATDDRCTRYKVNAAECNYTIVEEWDEYAIQETTLSIETDFIKDFSEILYFQLATVNQDTGDVCQMLVPDATIQING